MYKLWSEIFGWDYVLVDHHMVRRVKKTPNGQYYFCVAQYGYVFMDFPIPRKGKDVGSRNIIPLTKGITGKGFKGSRKPGRPKKESAPAWVFTNTSITKMQSKLLSPIKKPGPGKVEGPALKVKTGMTK